MSHSARAPVLASTLFPPGLTSDLQAVQAPKSDFSPLRQYNGALYKWTQQLMLHSQREHDSLKSSAATQDRSDTKNSPSSKFA
ncbi:hypothetical protein PTTG_27877 [Puccinia triticina 1-1 BBBD Race 1]|uniref:Uncharacterized protein n=2 Tax=Puccinia triticina TaxID=208348 RepID=A0A180GHH7_PUCT1|nr:uncharacterized protein PtA15_8A29 [Puccinia triticina]OAV91772.1 hypothetical protein PTTG_27877 [Puccinia triticina 1-1 BBBD Race 1]WAQ87128.1 hypothetical protein PtA15_8A29 [Puccinia triticina]WAR56988.1 hypothetical protein PtB15_8B32 [Puccinia triticina]